jgi:hypothetical protein
MFLKYLKYKNIKNWVKNKKVMVWSGFEPATPGLRSRWLIHSAMATRRIVDKLRLRVWSEAARDGC